ncbi:MAG: gamma-glutamyl-gamma-aminobutyrate hydrolase family protein [Syntrophales bacterium]|nr:gamma-glutamyl-gamma-aminobutyrate hydrolase family protein [Syntrophales bacterium]
MVKKRPKIGLNTSFNGEEATVPYGYVRAVVEAGGIPLLVPPVENRSLMRDLVDVLDGFLFIGGKDYHPKHYGGRPQTEEELVHPLRDSFDLVLARYILEETTLPVFGICGGMQLLTLAQGGRLIQNIPTDWHPPQGNPLNHKEGMHEVKIMADSFLARLLGSKSELLTITTNSSHHQAVDPQKPGTGFIPSAFAADGIVEAIEPDVASSWSRKKRFILGVQWHPERMEYDQIQKLLFHHFINAAHRT